MIVFLCIYQINMLTKYKNSFILYVDKERRLNMRKYFEFTRKYKFEYNDLRAFITVINVVLIMKFGLSVAWFGLAIAIIGLVKDFARAEEDGFINGNGTSEPAGLLHATKGAEVGVTAEGITYDDIISLYFSKSVYRISVLIEKETFSCLVWRCSQALGEASPACPAGHPGL